MDELEVARLRKQVKKLQKENKRLRKNYRKQIEYYYRYHKTAVKLRAAVLGERAKFEEYQEAFEREVDYNCENHVKDL